MNKPESDNWSPEITKFPLFFRRFFFLSVNFVLSFQWNIKCRDNKRFFAFTLFNHIFFFVFLLSTFGRILLSTFNTQMDILANEKLRARFTLEIWN